VFDIPGAFTIRDEELQAMISDRQNSWLAGDCMRIFNHVFLMEKKYERKCAAGQIFMKQKALQARFFDEKIAPQPKLMKQIVPQARFF